MNNGEYVVGDFNQLKAEPWATDHNKMNYSLIINQPYEDSYGNTQVQVARIDLNPDDYTRLQGRNQELQGKRVLVQVVISARTGGRTGSWKSIRMVKDSQLKIVTPKAE